MFPLAAKRNGIKAVWASEIEVFPLKVSQHHFPDMRHLGDICLINGGEIEPVDIITFGSPCQDLSIAGKREGMAGERSGLFSQAIRIIREMQEATNGKYPRYAIWENVPGAFSSNSGQDFRAVLEEITASEIPRPQSGKWANAGMVRGNGYSVAWRVCDAQYWGVAQRRKRIFLVADFRGQRAPEILFECESMSGYFETSKEAREEVAGSVGNGVEKPSGVWAFIGKNSAASRTIGETENISPTLDATKAGALAAQPGVHQQTFVIQSATMGGDKNQNGLGVSDGPCYTLDCRADHAVAHLIAFNGRQDPVYGAVTGAIDTDQATQCIAYPEPANALLAKGNLSYRADVDNLVCAVDVRNLYETEELNGTVQSKQTGGYSLNYQNPVRVGYAVRRLMPIECERLMSMPDGWTDIPGASNTARYKAIGNSLVMLIPDWIFSQINRIEIEEMLG